MPEIQHIIAASTIPMNTVEDIAKHLPNRSDGLALWCPQAGAHSYKEFLGLAGHQQQQLAHMGLSTGDTVLLAAKPSANMFATMAAVLASGAEVLIVEPWLSLNRLADIIDLTKPKVFAASMLGKAWGLRCRSVRQIPKRLTIEGQSPDAAAELDIVEVADDHPATVTFSSGSGGHPKGVQRSHGFIRQLMDVLTEQGQRDQFNQPDLSVFAGLTMLHLCTGRGSVIVDHSWSDKHLKKLRELPEAWQPATLSAGPAFLKCLIHKPGFDQLKSIYIGGALTDCKLAEQVCERWPAANIYHIYGGSEAEPIALCDAKLALEQSRREGYTQLLYIGEPISAIESHVQNEGLWVTGPNVCGHYVAAHERDLAHKQEDDQGRVWHLTNDRIEMTADGWFFKGRSFQNSEDFEMEQEVYAVIGHSQAFVHDVTDHRSGQVRKILVGEGLKEHLPKIKSQFPEIIDVVETPLRYDRRHRARIDRQATLRMPSLWQRWTRFFGERCPLPILFIIAAGPATGAASYFNVSLSSASPWLAMLAVVATLVVARLFDEVKDADKDRRINPARPLPRGLISENELRRLAGALCLGLGAYGFFLAINAQFLGTAMVLATILLLGALARDFYLEEWNQRHIVVSAVIHQLLVLPLYAIPLAVMAQDQLTGGLAAAFLGANFCASMAYELARKMDVEAPAEASQYAERLGWIPSTGLLALFSMGAVIGILAMGGLWPAAIGAAVCFGTLIAVAPDPAKHKYLELSASILSLITLWSLWLI